MGTTGWAGSVRENDYAVSWWLGGVQAVEDDASWEVSAGTGRQVIVDANGGAFACGVLSRDMGQLAKGLPTPTNGQWFLIVRRVNWANKTVTIEALGHSTTSTTVPTKPPTTFPSSVQSEPGVVFDQLLGWAWASSASTTVRTWDLRTAPLVNRFSGMIAPARFRGDWSLSAVTLSPGWDHLTDTQGRAGAEFSGGARVDGMTANVRFRCSRNGATITANSRGNLSPDVAVAAVEDRYAPATAVYGQWAVIGEAGGIARLGSDGGIDLLGANPSAQIVNNDIIQVDFTFLRG